MSKAQNPFYVIHSNHCNPSSSVAHVKIPFNVKKYNKNSFCDECWILLENAIVEVYKYCWNFAKVEIFEMLKSIKLLLVNLSSVTIHGCKIFYQ